MNVNISLRLELSPTEGGFPFTILQNVHYLSQNRLNIDSNPYNSSFPPLATANNDDSGLGNTKISQMKSKAILKTSFLVGDK